MLTQELEQLIHYALEDGVLTDKERSVLMRKAQEKGADLDEFEMILDAKLPQRLHQSLQVTNMGKFENALHVEQW